MEQLKDKSATQISPKNKVSDTEGILRNLKSELESLKNEIKNKDNNSNSPELSKTQELL